MHIYQQFFTLFNSTLVPYSGTALYIIPCPDIEDKFVQELYDFSLRMNLPSMLWVQGLIFMLFIFDDYDFCLEDCYGLALETIENEPDMF